MAVKGAIVEGMDFVKDQLTGFLPRESKAILRRTTAKIAANIRNDMRANAPRRDGTLRRAIVSKRRRGSKDSIEAAVFITRGKEARHDAFYWYFLEYGTKHSAAKPFATTNFRSFFGQDEPDKTGFW